MELHYFKGPEKNFGDDLNEWFWDLALPGFREWNTDVILIGIGTLLNEKRLAAFRDRKLLIVGAGVGYGGGPPILPLPSGWLFYAVRGPHSARALGLPTHYGITDPAVLLPGFAEFQGIETNGMPAFIPHHRSVNRQNWRSACEEIGMSYISPEDHAKTVIKRIAKASYVVTEAMHGAIVADAFRVPWFPVRIGSQFNEFKWRDWIDSLSIRGNPSFLHPRINSLSKVFPFERGKKYQERIRSKIESLFFKRGLIRCMSTAPLLSDNSVLKSKQKQLRLVLNDVKNAFS